nr:hypothetical protein GZ9D1_23 [uncultured archaeon GZfos9D1]
MWERIEGRTSPNTAYTVLASPLPFGTLLPSVATSYMLVTLYEIAFKNRRKTLWIK